MAHAATGNWIGMVLGLYVVVSLALFFVTRQLRLYPIYLIKSLWVIFTVLAFAWVVMMSGTTNEEFARHSGGFFDSLSQYPRAFDTMFGADLWWLALLLLPPLWVANGLLRRPGRVWVKVALIGVGAVALMPVVKLAAEFDWSAYGHFASNYRHAWQVARMGDATLNSVLVSACSVGLVAIVGSLAAYGLTRLRFRGRGLLMFVVVAGLAVPGVVLMVPLFVMTKDWTLWGLSFSNSRVGLALIYAAISLPFTVFLLSAFYRSLPSSLAHAAVVDGAGPWQLFSQVFFPLSGPALATVCIFNFLGVWNEYHFALVFLTNPEYRTLPVSLYNLQVSQQFAVNWPAMFAGIVILCLPTFLIFSVLQERIVAGITVGSVKG